VLGLLVAGHATVSAGLTWSLYLLAARPAVQRRIRAGARDTELLAPFSDAHCAVALGDEDRDARGEAFLDDLRYTRRVWQEAIRLYPPLPVFGRTVKEATTVGDQAVEPGMHVLLSPYVTHRDPEFWEAPDEFDPGRFEADRAADRHEFAYLPFSRGRHACLVWARPSPPRRRSRYSRRSVRPTVSSSRDRTGPTTRRRSTPTRHPRSASTPRSTSSPTGTCTCGSCRSSDAGASA
jgi:hypothetical protein